MYNACKQIDVDYIKAMAITDTAIKRIIDDIQHINHPDSAPFYLDYLEERLASIEEYSYINALEDFLLKLLPEEFELVGIGSNRIVLGYKDLVVKIWYKSNVQHLDDLYVESHYSKEIFPYKQDIYYYDNTMLIAKRYALFVDSDSSGTEDEAALADEGIYDKCRQSVIAKLKELNMNPTDITMDNLGYDKELEIPIVLDCGFMVGDSSLYLLFDAPTVLQSTLGKTIAVKSISVVDNETYLFNTESPPSIKCRAYHIHDNNFLVQALFTHVLCSLNSADSLISISDCISATYEFLYELDDLDRVFYFVSYSKHTYCGEVEMGDEIDTINLMRYIGYNDQIELVCSLDICAKSAYIPLCDAANSINRALYRMAKIELTEEKARKVFSELIKLRFDVVPAVLIKQLQLEYDEFSDVEEFDR